MALVDDLRTEVEATFASTWTSKRSSVAPDDKTVTLANDGVTLDATVLYADLDESTALVDNYKAPFAAEIYKTFLRCAAKIIKAEGGDVTAYDGDRVMAVFLGDSKNTSAARAALKLNYARVEIINPAIAKQYGAGSYTLKQVVGVDTSELLVAKTGVRGANDLVWVGRAANHASKLCGLSADYPTRITGEVFERLNASMKVSGGRSVWEKATWTPTGRTIYRSKWRWYI